MTEFRSNISFAISCDEGYGEIGFEDVIVCALSNTTNLWTWPAPGPRCEKNDAPTNSTGKTLIIISTYTFEDNFIGLPIYLEYIGTSEKEYTHFNQHARHVLTEYTLVVKGID